MGFPRVCWQFVPCCSVGLVVRWWSGGKTVGKRWGSRGFRSPHPSPSRDAVVVGGSNFFLKPYEETNHPGGPFTTPTPSFPHRTSTVLPANPRQTPETTGKVGCRPANPGNPRRLHAEGLTRWAGVGRIEGTGQAPGRATTAADQPSPAKRGPPAITRQGPAPPITTSTPSKGPSRCRNKQSWRSSRPRG